MEIIISGLLVLLVGNQFMLVWRLGHLNQAFKKMEERLKQLNEELTLLKERIEKLYLLYRG
jgi:uncharacterized protein (DUF342 family)